MALRLTISLITLFCLYLVYYYYRKKTNPFRAKVAWWQSGLSLFAVNFSLVTPMLYSGVIEKEGIGGIWIFWSTYLVSGFMPFVFAPLWAKMNFTTDNQFILVRFSGIGAKVLHIFRALYVGWFIVAFLLSFQLLTIYKVVNYYVAIDRTLFLAFLGIVLLLVAVKNRLAFNIRLDVIQAVFILFCFLFALFYIWHSYQNSTILIETTKFRQVFPLATWDVLVYFFIQTWSVKLFDGSGIEAQRFVATENKKEVWKVAALSTGVAILVSMIFVLIIFLSSQMIQKPSSIDGEQLFLFYLDQLLPQWFLPFMLIAFFASFFTTFEGLLNWGSSFLTIDVYKEYLWKKKLNYKVSQVAVFSMLLVTSTSLFFAFYNSSLLELIKIFFGISAGVAPVFVLRWFWKRINAWSQLTAMISSLVYSFLYSIAIGGKPIENEIVNQIKISTYSFKIICLTVLTSFTWILITFLTPKDKFHNTKGFDLISLNKASNSLPKALIFGVFALLLLVAFLSILSSL